MEPCMESVQIFILAERLKIEPLSLSGRGSILVQTFCQFCVYHRYPLITQCKLCSYNFVEMVLACGTTCFFQRSCDIHLQEWMIPFIQIAECLDSLPWLAHNIDAFAIGSCEKTQYLCIEYKRIFSVKTPGTKIWSAAGKKPVHCCLHMQTDTVALSI